MNNDTRADNILVAETAAAMLGSIGTRLNGWSMVFALATILMVVLKAISMGGAALLLTSLMAALAQLYFALRCAFDAAVFKSLGGVEDQYRNFDRLLLRWRLLKASDIATTRSIEQRAQGALRLLRRQAYCFVLQITLLGLGVIFVVSQGSLL